MLSPEARLSRFIVIALIVIASFHLVYLHHQRFQIPWHVPMNSLIHSPSYAENTTTATAITPFPKKIWQTGKTGFVNLESDFKDTITTWHKLNTDWRYELLTDNSAETYVRSTFSSRPSIVELYTGIGDPILRADMLRYLLLLGDGGVYCDMDTRALKPIEKWIPLAYASDTNVVVGIEYDRRDGGRWLDWTLDLQLTNWAMMAKPGHPVLELTLDRLASAVYGKAREKDSSIAHLQLSQHEILNTTGPALFTMAVFEYLQETLSEPFTWLNVSRLKRPMLVEDVLILPINGFGSGQPHSGSGNEAEDDALVKHLFKGSWKHDRPMKPEEEEEEEEKEGEKKEAKKKTKEKGDEEKETPPPLEDDEDRDGHEDR